MTLAAVETPRYLVTHHGDPMPMPRPKFRMIAGHGSAYFPAAATHRRDEIAAAWRQAGHGSWPVGVSLGLSAVFCFERPRFHFGAGRNEGQIKPQYLARRPGKGGGQRKGQARTGADLDNLLKLLMDALAGVAFPEDGAVAELRATKRYVDTVPDATEPCTVVELWAL